MTTTSTPSSADWLLHQLPGVYLEDDFFRRFVAMFAELAESTLDHADMLPVLADLAVTPAPMVAYLASWIGVDFVDPSLPIDRQRTLVAHLGELLPWRGTKRGLVELLRLLTDGDVTVEDTGGVYARQEAPTNQKVVTVRVAGAGAVPTDQLADLISAEIPADCRLELWVDGKLAPGRSRRVRDQP